MADRGRILIKAHEIINGERQDQYGNPENNFGAIARYWTIYLQQKKYTNCFVTSEDVALMMAMLKLARIASGSGTQDSFIDACGYVALAEDMAKETRDE